MIRLRQSLERGRRHPLLGPILLLLLVLVLALTFLHVAQDGHEAAADLGAACLALVSFLGVLVAQRLRRSADGPRPALRAVRAPPLPGSRLRLAAVVPAASLSLPLRR